MVTINKTSLNYITPQTTRVMTEKAKELSSRSLENLGVIIKKEKLQELVNQKKTLNEMAQFFNTSIGSVRYYLNKYDITRESVEELVALRKYFSAKTSQDKSEAFSTVDKYLKQIAQEKYQSNRTTTMEDCLQDVRLNFLELSDKKEKGKDIGSKNIFNILRESASVNQEELNTVDLELAADKTNDVDFLIQYFEESDIIDYLVEHSGLSGREIFVFENWFKEGRSFKELADTLSLSSTQVKNIFDKALKKIDKRRDCISSEEYLKRRSQVGWDAVKPVYIRCRPLEGSEHYAWLV